MNIRNWIIEKLGGVPRVEHAAKVGQLSRELDRYREALTDARAAQALLQEAEKARLQEAEKAANHYREMLALRQRDSDVIQFAPPKFRVRAGCESEYRHEFMDTVRVIDLRAERFGVRYLVTDEMLSGFRLGKTEYLLLSAEKMIAQLTCAVKEELRAAFAKAIAESSIK